MEVVNAESTPAPATPVDGQAVLNTMTSEQRTEWKKTGALPEAKAEGEESPASDAPKAENSETVPASEPGKPSAEAAAGEKPKNAETRIRELVAERNTEKERADRLEARLRDVESGKKPDEKPAAAESSPAKEAQPGDLKAPEKPKRPKLEDFDTIEQFEAAQDKYADAYDAYLEQKLEFRDKKREADAAQAERSKAEEQQKTEFSKKIDKATERHPDFKEKLMSAKHLGKIRQGSLIDSAILRRETGADLLYHFASNEAELDRVLAMDAIDQGAELKAIEAKLSKTPSVKPKSSDKPQIEPPEVVGGKGTAPVDPVESAVANNDFVAYKRAANARDLKK